MAEQDESILVRYARDEMERAGMFDADADYGPELAESILTVVETFVGFGHSGGSAMLVLDVLDRVLRFEPLTPLTYAEDEWVEIADGVWQNRRKWDVFSRDGGRTWECNDGISGTREGSTHGVE